MHLDHTADLHLNRQNIQEPEKIIFEMINNKSNENFKTTIPSNNYDRPKTTGECGMF